MTEEDKRMDDRSDGSDSEDEAPATGGPSKQSAVVIPDMKETQVDPSTLNPLTPSVIAKQATIVRPCLAF